MSGGTGAESRMRKETGLIMSTPMMIADLKKIKKQTRRTWGLSDINIHPDDWQLVAVFQDGLARFYNKTIDVERTIQCPYGGVGDKLVLKETWFADKQYDNLKPSLIPTCSLIGYIATDIKPDWGGKTRTSMFMPKWASRRSHILTNIRCERVQAITKEDVIKEGTPIVAWNEGSGIVIPISPNYKMSYALLWDKLNAKRGYPWSKNVYVWILEWKE